MRFSGSLKRVGRYWAADVPLLGVHTQGRSKGEARGMVADAIESLVDREGFACRVLKGRGGYFEVTACDPAPLVAMMLSHLRAASGLTLSQVASRLGARSNNAYARYEQGRSVPTVHQLDRLLRAVSPDADFLIEGSRLP